MSENVCEGSHIFTEQGLLGFKSGPANKLIEQTWNSVYS